MTAKAQTKATEQFDALKQQVKHAAGKLARAQAAYELAQEALAESEARLAALGIDVSDPGTFDAQVFSMKTKAVKAAEKLLKDIAALQGEIDANG